MERFTFNEGLRALYAIHHADLGAEEVAQTFRRLQPGPYEDVEGASGNGDVVGLFHGGDGVGYGVGLAGAGWKFR